MPKSLGQTDPDKPESSTDTGGESNRGKGPKPKEKGSSGEWDPKDPAAVQYSDGAWGLAYNDAAIPVKLLFRRSLGGADPQYWRDPVTVETGAEIPAMITLGSSTAVFYRKTVGTVGQVFLKTSGDDGATWSAGTQLTSETTNVYQIQASNVGGTIHLFWSRSDTSGLLQYARAPISAPGARPRRSDNQLAH